MRVAEVEDTTKTCPFLVIIINCCFQFKAAALFGDLNLPGLALNSTHDKDNSPRDRRRLIIRT